MPSGQRLVALGGRVALLWPQLMVLRPQLYSPVKSVPPPKKKKENNAKQRRCSLRGPPPSLRSTSQPELGAHGNRAPSLGPQQGALGLLVTGSPCAGWAFP